MSQHRVVLIRKPHNKIVGVCHSSCLDNLVPLCFEPSISDVLEYSGVEEIDVLAYEGNLAPPKIKIEFTQGVAIHENGSVGGIVKTKQQLYNRRLPAARWPHERGGPA